MTLTDLSTTGFADSYTATDGDTFFLHIDGDAGSISSTRAMPQPEFEGTAEQARLNFGSWRGIADGTDLGPIPADHQTLAAYKASGAKATDHPEAKVLLNLLGEIAWMGRGQMISFHRRCAAEYLIRKGDGCIPLMVETRTAAEKDAEADRYARQHLWEAELAASNELIAWFTAGFGPEAIDTTGSDDDDLRWPCTAREFLDGGGLAADGPGGDELDTLIDMVGTQGRERALNQAIEMALSWHRSAQNVDLEDEDPAKMREHNTFCRLHRSYLWQVELLADPVLAMRWLMTVPQSERDEHARDVVDYLDAEAKPFRIDSSVTAEQDLRCSITGDPIAGPHVTLFDRLEDKTAVVLSPAAVTQITTALGIAQGAAPLVPTSTVALPDNSPVDADQVAAFGLATATATATRQVLDALVQNPAVLDALRTWHAATEVTPDSDERMAVLREHYEDWRIACGVEALADAAWPLIELARILAIDTEPPAVDA
jgi:hypothetical protein